MNVTTKLTTLLLVNLLFGSALAQEDSTRPAWRKIDGNWPDTSNQVRAMASTKGQIYIGTGGTVARSAQVWKHANAGWVKHAEFNSLKVAVIQADTAGNLYVGTGTPHSAEVSGMGHAGVWRIDATGRKTRLKAFSDKDVAYSMAWFQDKLHVGTMSEDLPGTAEIWRFDDPGWTQIAGQGINAWPSNNSYAAVYEMWVHDGELIAGTFSRSMGDGDVLKLVGNRWVDLEAPETIIALSLASYRGKLVAALSNVNARHPNPIFSLASDGTWQPLGNAPVEWETAYIHNHMVVQGAEMYAGVGGTPGTLSVWKYDGLSWTKLAGDGLYGSWHDPLVRQGAEWVYRLTLYQGKLYAGLASDRAPFQAQVWEMRP